jgi:hypothetical protein
MHEVVVELLASQDDVGEKAAAQFLRKTQTRPDDANSNPVNVIYPQDPALGVRPYFARRERANASQPMLTWKVFSHVQTLADRRRRI